MSALPMFTDSDVRRIASNPANAGEPFHTFFAERCQALLAGIRISRRGYLIAENVDYETLQDVVTHLLEKGVLGFFNVEGEDGLGPIECIGIRNQMGGCGRYINGHCPLPGQDQFNTP